MIIMTIMIKAEEIFQSAKALLANANNLSSNSGFQMMEGKHWVPMVVLSPLHIYHNMCAVVQVFLHSHKLTIPKKKLKKKSEEKVIDEQAGQNCRYVEDFVVIWFNKLANQFGYGLQGGSRGNQCVTCTSSYKRHCYQRVTRKPMQSPHW